MREPLPKPQFDRIFSGGPRLTVEVVIRSPERGVLLWLRDIEPCRDMWHLPGGTARFGEPVADAVKRVAEQEMGVTVAVGPPLGYIEYPSHYNDGLDSPVGLACTAELARAEAVPARCRWFTTPDNMHDEQRRFLIGHQLAHDAVTGIGERGRSGT